MILALLLVPLVSGVAAFWWRHDAGRRALLIVAALVHSGVTAATWRWQPTPLVDGWLDLDSAGRLFLSILSALFLVAAIYGVGYLAREKQTRHIDFQENQYFSNEPEAVFTACLLFFLASMTLVTLSQHFGLLWVAIEATTLASAPLIYFHRQHRSLEATWKYLLICSVGIAIALVGNFLLAVAAAGLGDAPGKLILANLVHAGSGLHRPWLEAAFIFFLVGYGTKMGLAPLHTWLPDAHSESPSVVSALLSGALLNCAFLGILRAHQVCLSAGAGDFSAGLLLVFGLFSMAIAAVFILGQVDFKRMLAYSSVEHMGILAVGVGLGGAGVFGSALHAVNHSLTKAGLFLVAGNILRAYQSKQVNDVRGLNRVLPWSGVLWLAGFLAITGTPPFGPFLSEFTILKAAVDQSRWLVTILYLGLLGLIFIAMANIVLRMGQGGGTREPAAEPVWSIVPPATLCVVVLVLGVYVPPEIRTLLNDVSRALGGR
jgi:hydrogenase-4 component F